MGAQVILWVQDETTGEPKPCIRDANGRLKVVTSYGLHHTHHENGGNDEISVAGLSGLLADGQTPLAHKTSHQDGGGDEISVAGLSGLLADRQHPSLDDFDWAIFHDFTNWTSAKTGNGVVTLGVRRNDVNSCDFAAVSTAKASIPWFISKWDWDKDFIFSFSFILIANYGTGSHLWIYVSPTNAADDPAAKAIGFRLDDNALKGITYDTELHVVDLGITLSPATVYSLKIVFTAGSQVEWFVGGVSKGTSTDIPDSFSTGPYLVHATAGSGVGLCGIQGIVARWAYIIEW